MDLDFFWLGLGLAAFGYFIGDGLKNFKNSKSPNDVENIFGDDERNEFIKESDLHWEIGIRKEDAKKLVEQYPDIPHLEINGQIYYPKQQLQQWINEFENKK